MAGICLAGALLVCPAIRANAADSAVVFMYHRFGDSRFATTNIRLEQFEAHLEEIVAGGYHVAALGDIVAAFRRREALPDRTIALSIDDAFRSVYTEAWPRLRKAGLPFTLFVATGPVDAGHSDYMTWDQLSELATAGVAIGSQTADHPHMPALSARENERELARSNRRFNDELGFTPNLIAYPYGEYGEREKQIVREAGFVAAFGQHSGVGHAGADIYGLPRFAMTERFGSIERFRLAANALPLYLYDLTPADTVLKLANNPPPFGFTVAEGQEHFASLNCYASNQAGPAPLERLGQRRIEVRLSQPFQPGRSRINCTLPGPNMRWRWFGIQFYVPEG